MARTAKRYRDMNIPDMNAIPGIHNIQNNCIIKNNYIILEEGSRITNAGTPRYYVGIYSRLSVDNDEKKSESVENQIEVAKQYIEKNNSNPMRKMELLIYDSYIDKGKSGTTFSRPAFQRMMGDVRDKRVTCIMVKDFSRFGRDYIETGNYIEKILPFLGVRFISVADSFDSMSETAGERKLAMNIKNLVNDMYAKDISRKVSLSRKLSAERGSFNGSRAPYGYTVVNRDGIRTLVAEEEPAEIVRWIFEQYADGMTEQEICAVLFERKVHRVSDYWGHHHVYYEEDDLLHQWKADVIKKMFQNQAYIGNLIQKSHKFDNAHEAIVSREVFEKVQQRLLEAQPIKKESALGKKKVEPDGSWNIYRNVIFCGDCGRKLKAPFYQSRINGARHYSYCCSAAYYEDYRKCKKKCVSEELLDRKLREVIKEQLEKNGMKGKKLSSLNMAGADRKMAQHESEMAQIRKEVEGLKKKASILFAGYKEGTVTKTEYMEFKKFREASEGYQKKRLVELEKKNADIKNKAEKENKFLRSLLKAESSKKLNREIVESFVEKILLYENKTIEIVLKCNGGDPNGR